MLDGVAELIAAGDDVTFAKAAAAAGVPERTVYRHFPTRDALVAALFEHTNERIGFGGTLPRTGAEMTAMVQQVFPGFDAVAPVVAELLASPEGRRARLGALDERRAAARASSPRAVRTSTPSGPSARRRRAGARHGGGLAGAARLLGPGRAGPRRPRSRRRSTILLDPRTPTKEPVMDLLSGVNHIAVLTADLDRFVDFYTEVFDVEVVFTEDDAGLPPRHPAHRPVVVAAPGRGRRQRARHGVAGDVRPRPPRPRRADGAATPAAFATIRERLVARGRDRRRGRGPRRLPQRVVRRSRRHARRARR